MKSLNEWQRVAAKTYAGGHFEYVQTLEECRNVGDTLFTFVMNELDEGEGSENWNVALRRIRQAINDLEQVYAAVNMARTDLPKIG